MACPTEANEKSATDSKDVRGAKVFIVVSTTKTCVPRLRPARFCDNVLFLQTAEKWLHYRKFEVLVMDEDERTKRS
jgi:hypothetical protein